MAYTKSTITEALRFFSNRRYPKKLSRRESRLYQSAVDTVLADSYTATASYTVTDEIKTILSDTTAGAQTITLPSAVLFPGRQLTVYVTDATATTTVDAAAGTVGAAANGAFDAAGDNATWLSDGTNWVLINDNVA